MVFSHFTFYGILGMVLNYNGKVAISFNITDGTLAKIWINGHRGKIVQNVQTNLRKRRNDFVNAKTRTIIPTLKGKKDTLTIS